MAKRFYIAPRILHPSLERLFKRGNSKAVVGLLNCYGAAVLPRLKAPYDFPQPGHFSQGFRTQVFAFEIERTLPTYLFKRYMTLADGHIPLTHAQAFKAGPRNHVFVGIVGGSSYHYYFRSRYQHNGKPVWLHKNGATDMSHSQGSQDIITDIARALREYHTGVAHRGDGMIGYFKFPRRPVRAGQKQPPVYSAAAVRDMAAIYHAYLDAREQKAAGYSSRISEADILTQRVKESAPHMMKGFKAILDIMKVGGLMPDMFRPLAQTANALADEIKALGLGHHPAMASVMARIEEKSHRRRMYMAHAAERRAARRPTHDAHPVRTKMLRRRPRKAASDYDC